MPVQSPATRFVAAFAAASFLAGSAASAAPRTVDPLLALSVFASSESRAAVCAAGAAAAAAAGAATAAQAAPATPGCVLPVVDAAPPPVVETPPPPVVEPPLVEEPGKSIGMLPLLLGLGAIVAAALLLLGDDDDDDDIDIPVSPN